MPVAGGECADCGKPTAKFTSLRCQPCNNKFRKGKLLRSTRARKLEKLRAAKCPICGNLNHLNFTQEKIWKLKENAETYKALAAHELKALHSAYSSHRYLKEKIKKAIRFRDQVFLDTKKHLISCEKLMIS